MKKNIQTIMVAASLISVACTLSIPAQAQVYDLVINNGRVMDPETQFDAVANIGIRDGRIVAISHDALTGGDSIDATGLVVAPGFIDTHFHAVDRFATKMTVADGVTTGMDLELGATSVGEWYAQKDATGWQINYGTTASHILSRIIVHDPEVEITTPIDAAHLDRVAAEAAADGTAGWSLNRSDVAQMNAVMSLLDEGLREGAIGVGVGAAYMQRGMTSYEQFEAQRTAANYGRLSSVHTRFHLNTQTPNEAAIGFDEVLANALTLQAPLIVAHDNDYGWWENEEKLQLARAQGHNVWGEYYPFTAGSTLISADFLRPEIWEETSGYRYEDTLYDPGADKFLSKSEYLAMVEDDPSHVVIVHLPPRKAWLPLWPTIPHMVVASDAMMGHDAEGNLLPYDADTTLYAGHPRTASSYSTTLALARELDVPLMFTLAQLSYWNAKHLGDSGLESMQQRGRIQVGMIADLTIFDAATVAPQATYKAGENGLPPVGIPYVVINGTVVVRDSEVLDVRPGQPIRFPVEQQGRFVPLDTDDWIGAIAKKLAETPE